MKGKKKSPIWGEEEDMLDWGEKKEIKIILYFMNGEKWTDDASDYTNYKWWGDLLWKQIEKR